MLGVLWLFRMKTERSFFACFLVAILVASVILPTVSAVDTMGMELMMQVMIALMLRDFNHRKVGCPDRDGDELATGQIHGQAQTKFPKEFSIPQNYDFNDADYSPDGEWVATADENGYLRVWNASTGVNDRSVVAYSGGMLGLFLGQVMEDTSE